MSMCVGKRTFSAETKKRTLRDIIYCGFNSQYAKEKAIQQRDEVTFHFITKVARQEVSTKRHLSMIQSNSTASGNYLQYDLVKQRGSKKNRTVKSGNSLGQQQVSHGSNPKHGKFQTHLKGKICFRCGKQSHQQG